MGEKSGIMDTAGPRKKLLGPDELADLIDGLLDHKYYPPVIEKPVEGHPDAIRRIEAEPFKAMNGTYSFQVYRGNNHIQLWLFSTSTKKPVRTYTLYHRQNGWEYLDHLTGHNQSSLPEFNDDYRRFEEAMRKKG